MLVWFYLRSSLKLPNNGEKPVTLKKGEAVELFVIPMEGREEDDRIGIIVSGSLWEIGSFKNIKDLLILPEKCMISEVGDIFCAKEKELLAVVPIAGPGRMKVIYYKRGRFKYCPLCGGQLVEFPRSPNRGGSIRVANALALGIHQ